MGRYKISSLVFMLISILGLFGPWFYFSRSVDYSNGWIWQPSIMTFGYFLYFVMMFVKESENSVKIAIIVACNAVIIDCIYKFFTWHIPTITGEFSFRISYDYAHWGFYVTLVAAIISMIIYIVGWKKSKV